jgi:PhnB protein
MAQFEIQIDRGTRPIQHGVASTGRITVMAPHRSGLVAYLFYEDASTMIDWYTTVFGFKEHSRYTNADGKVTNAELIVGDTELWMDGKPPASWSASGVAWIGVWVDDPDAIYERIKAHGLAIAAPEDKPYGVRLTGVVEDPAGYRWGFMRRLDE